jgi:PiT family inorganic phosphate transporter
LIGGLIGAGVTKAGEVAVVWTGVLKTGGAIVLSPLTGFFLALTLVLTVSWIFVRTSPRTVDTSFRSLQFVSASLYSLGHGGNDAQKTMGIITGLLVASGYLTQFAVPLWVILLSHAAIALGTLFGGWRIVKTMGTKITKLQPIGGFSAETGAALAIYIATLLGVGISTTHTITGAIVGVGSTRRLSAVRWGIAGQIVWAWLLTIPASAVIGALTYGVISTLFGAV